jgi:hypothetical protein
MPIRPRSGRSRVLRQRKSCCSSRGLGLLKAEHLTAPRIDPGHHMPDGAVLPCRVQPLEDQKDGLPVGRAVKLLQRAQLRDMLFQQFLILLLRFVHGIDDRRPFLQVDLVSFPDAEIL